ncbi:MAG TPA: DNA-processing protein DprA [Vicinamibacterales bacterium]|jgi:DNA processing protein|nr:DNA-processing protein DprA [Vicinamibacterales bacterium]
MASLDSLDLVALSLMPASFGRAIAAGLRLGESPADLLARLLAQGPSTPSAAALRARAAVAVARAVAHGISRIGWNDPDYPPLLSAILDPPPLLFVRGAREALRQPAVAVIGSRAGSPYSIAVAEKIAADLADRRIAVVSGLARGVDAAAHRGALAAGGSTIAVMGCGIDVIYPPEHRPLANDIACSTGTLVSELAPGTPPLARFFPRRNRIISGLCQAVVVVEAGVKSGSLITAKCALEQGREVLAVPGSILSDRNRGGHALIRDGAKLVESVDDIVEELGFPGLTAVNPGVSTAASKWSTDAANDPVLACLLPGEPSDLDSLVEKSGLHSSRLLPRLFELELQGLVRRAGGGRFVRFDRSC